ncbi:hypothetical protein GCM10009868_34320 [Terrabacter aerolatus]|nr:helix-turn-helix domain-containing protein [Terrabacter aerolatus]
MTQTHPSTRQHDDLMAPHEVARIFRVSPGTITRWARVGLLPFTCTPGGHRRFDRSCVVAHLERLAREGDDDRVRLAHADD